MTLHLLEQQIRARWPPNSWCDVTVLVAVSGGPDSVALLRALLASALPGAGRLIVAHFNHGLRGQESDDDEHFVRQLSERLGLICEVGTTSLPEATKLPASEESAREARYAFLREAAARHGARYVATGHTADDQAETVLHRLIRGTGIAGLAGIRSTRELLHGVSLIRPLLGVRRSDVLNYLNAIGQEYRQDSSNRSPHFTRNRLRHDLIPRIEQQYNVHLADALGRLASLAEEVQEWIEQEVEPLMSSCVTLTSDQRVTVDCRVLQPIRPLLVRELFVAIWKHQGWPRQAMVYDKWDDLAQLALEQLNTGDRRRQMFPGGVSAERLGPLLTLTGPDDASS